MAKIVLIGSLAESLINFRGDLIAALQGAGHQVIALAPPGLPETSAELQRRGVVFKTIQLSRTGLNPLADLRSWLELRRILAAEKPDMVLAYTIKPVIYGLLAARSLGLPRCALITGLGYAFTQSGGGKLRQLLGLVAATLYKLALQGARTVFFQNPDDRDFFLHKHILPLTAPIRIIAGSGVNTARFTPAPLPSAPVFLMIARLLGDKGVREYAGAAALVKQQFPQASFHLVGPVDPNPSAISQAELDSWVTSGTLTYHGSTNDVRPFIATCSVYVLPSYREGTPRTVLEAMAMGRAIITTDAPGCRETVKHGENGLLVPVKDTQALAQAMLKLGQDEALREQMAAAGLALVRSKYDVNLVNAQILDGLGLPSGAADNSQAA